jgi:NAD(P)H-dependent FMN reductase
MKNIMIFSVSTREGRVGDKVSKFVADIASKQEDTKVDYVDLRGFDLGLYSEAIPPMGLNKMNQEYTNPKANEWAKRVNDATSFVIVTPEYNHTLPASMVSFFEWFLKEWNGKKVLGISYSIGQNAGRRAITAMLPIFEELNLTLSGEINIPEVRNDNYSEVLPKFEESIKSEVISL